jgi:Carboxypeptidase regulatory-like domain
MEQALNQEDGLGSIPGINDTVAGPIADQLLNCFAFGDPNMVGQSNWQDPGVGNAVSPGNIALWSPPYFGYAEPLQYLPSHTDQYTPSEWVKVTTHGTISGKVTRSDTGAPVPGALVWANLNVDGMYAHSGAYGSYTLPTVPLGTYALKATATLTVGSTQEEFTNDQGVDYTLTSANNGNGVQDLVISPPPAIFRQINIEYQISADHGDSNPWNPHGVETAGY